MTDKSLMIFRTAAESGNFSETARRLDISPAKVTRTIISLEAEFGRSLFNKENRPATLTEFGCFVKEILDNGQSTSQRIERYLKEREQNTIRIGCAFPASWRSVSGISGKLKRKDPSVKLAAVAGESSRIIKMLFARELDIAVVPDRISIEDYRMAGERICNWIIAAPYGVPLTDRNYLTPDDLDAVPLLIPAERSGIGAVGDWLGKRYDIDRSDTYNDRETMECLIEEGCGCAFFPQAGADALLMPGLMIYACIPKITTALYVYINRRSPHPDILERFAYSLEQYPI